MEGDPPLNPESVCHMASCVFVFLLDDIAKSSSACAGGGALGRRQVSV
jgi:hypothetical protein|tara:strand:- start:605 stop:748 length:144 start_codon:yes stop_codon:yes gene_type:complete